MTNEKKETPVAAVSTENIYRLNGRVPLGKAIPFGLQHVLAMFVSNLAPVLIVCSAALVRGSGEPLTGAEITQLLQCAMFAAGIGTCMQLYPIWKIGSRLPIVMGVSFTFLGSLLMICTNPELGYEGMIGAVILGGIFEGLVGLSAKYWKRFLTPVVSACVVIAIGYSLLSVGMDSWGGGNGAEDFGSWYHLLIGLITLVVCLVSRYLLKGVYKNLNILVGLIVGYIISALFTVTGVAKMINFSSIGTTIHQVGYFSLPKLVFFTDHKPVFDGRTAGFSCCRRLFQCHFRLLRMPSADFFQSECRTGDHDRCNQPIYDPDGSINPDSCLSFPAAGSILQLSPTGCSWRLYCYDVRIDHV